MGVGAALLPVGVYCLKTAIAKNLKYVPLAAIPIFFGVQQIIEGFVWIGIEGADAVLVRRASLGFLAFAFVFWPFWIPFSALAIGDRGWVKTVNVILAILGLAFGLYLYVPVLVHSKEWLVTKVHFHSIQYDFGTFQIFQFVPGFAWQFCYVVIVSLPLLISKRGLRLRTFGSLLGVSAVVGQVAFLYAFISVWCLFAAALSLYLIYIFRGLAAHPSKVAAPLAI